MKVTKLDAITVAEFGISVPLHRDKIFLCVCIGDIEFTINNQCKAQVPTRDTKTMSGELLQKFSDWSVSEDFGFSEITIPT